MGQWSHRRHPRAAQGGGVTGTVRSVPVQDFQKVRSGQAIVELDDADYQAMVNEAQSAIQAAHSWLRIRTQNAPPMRASKLRKSPSLRLKLLRMPSNPLSPCNRLS